MVACENLTSDGFTACCEHASQFTPEGFCQADGEVWTSAFTDPTGKSEACRGEVCVGAGVDLVSRYLTPLWLM